MEWAFIALVVQVHDQRTYVCPLYRKKCILVSLHLFQGILLIVSNLEVLSLNTFAKGISIIKVNN